MKNFDKALEPFGRPPYCGPGWKLEVYRNHLKCCESVRLMHIDGFAEEFDITDESLFDNPVGALHMVRDWVVQRTNQPPLAAPVKHVHWDGFPSHLAPALPAVKTVTTATTNLAEAAQMATYAFERFGQAALAAFKDSARPSPFVPAPLPALKPGRTRLIELDD